MKVGRMVTYLVLLIVVGFAAYVRLAPSDPARWHSDPVTDAQPDCTIVQARDSARVACLMPGTAEAVLSALDAVALQDARTKRLAGQAAEGRITWVTRTAIWGFPDYTTAQAQTVGDQTRIDIYARQRFGSADWGVNAARLRDWLSRLSG